MSRLQPTLSEARDAIAAVERALTHAVEVVPVEGGFWVRYKRQRYGWTVLWPVSSIVGRCDDCGNVLRATRDAGGQGFYYDKRWLKGEPAKRDPRLHLGYEPHFVCMPCMNRARPAIRAAQNAHDIRLLINRIGREIKNAA